MEVNILLCYFQIHHSACTDHKLAEIIKNHTIQALQLDQQIEISQLPLQELFALPTNEAASIKHKSTLICTLLLQSICTIFICRIPKAGGGGGGEEITEHLQQCWKEEAMYWISITQRAALGHYLKLHYPDFPLNWTYLNAPTLFGTGTFYESQL